MRRLPLVLLTTFISAVLVLGCNGEQPLEPASPADGVLAKGGGQELAPPYGAAATDVSETQIDIRWSDNSTNESRFEVHRSTTGTNGSFDLLATTEADVVLYSDSALEVERLWCYKIRAVRMAGNRTSYSAFSNTACAITRVPVEPPSNVTAVGSSPYQIDLSWDDNSSAETSFLILIADSEAGPYAVRSTVAANVVTHSDYGMSPGRRYCYRVQAMRQYTIVDGNTTSTNYTYSAYSNTTCAVAPAPTDPPTATYEVSVSPTGSSAVEITVRRVSSSWTSIRVDRSTDGGAFWEQVTLPNYYESTFWDSPRPSEQLVCYRVVPYNEAGEGQPSNTACTAPPAAPTNLTSTPVDAETIELTWSDNSAVEDGYQVWFVWGYGNCSCGASACDAGWSEGESLVAELPANSTVFRAAPLSGNVCQPYVTSYYIVARKDRGSSDQSNWLSWQPDMSP